MKRGVVLLINSESLGLGLYESVVRSVTMHSVSRASRQILTTDLLAEAFIVVQ
jgi:hypothetical protein